MKRSFATARIGALTVLLAMSAARASAQDTDLTTARDLYASAAYDDALTVLNRLRSSDHPASQSRAIEQYRAFCLLALGRSADAEQAIEAVVAAEPTFQPGETDASPRIRSAFTSVRRRMLPSIIQQKYAPAKAAFDRKDFAAAADGFTQVLNALADPDVAAEAQAAAAVGSADARRRLPGARGQGRGAAAAAAARRSSSPPPPPPTPVAPRIYTGGETGIVPPAVVNQTLPPFPGQVIIPRNGKLEVVIDEIGAVESAVMTRLGDAELRRDGADRDQEHGATSRRR